MTTGIKDHVDPLTAMLYPAYTKRCDHCGGFVAISPDEALSRALQAAYQPWTALASAIQPTAASTATGAASSFAPTAAPTSSDWLTTWTRPSTHHGHHHRHHHGDCGCGCERCGGDDCHCRCCVVNADLVVNARLGERRLVPLTLENNRRREREIRLELSEFNSRGGSPSGVTGELLTPAEFTLASCEEREVLIGIQVGEDKDQGAAKAKQPAAGRDVKERAAVDENRLPDVDECRVSYADLRIVGCDNRPIRIGVATLPRDCHDYRIDCACGCC